LREQASRLRGLLYLVYIVV